MGKARPCLGHKTQDPPAGGPHTVRMRLGASFLLLAASLAFAAPAAASTFAPRGYVSAALKASPSLGASR
jgi:hypothetical protein